jgi:hypothetical protein
MRIPALLIALAALAGCVSNGTSLEPGRHDAAAVRAEMGAPAEILKAPHGGEVWFYPRGRVGRETYRAEIGPDGRLVRPVEQVLYEKNFDRIIDGKTTREELRLMLGPPVQEWIGVNGWEVIWDYPYKWAQMPWMLHVGIDQKGVVTSQFRRNDLNAAADRL